MEIKRALDESVLNENNLKFYASLKVSEIVNVSCEKIQQIASMASMFSELNNMNNYTMHSRWMSAINKAYNSSLNNRIVIGDYKINSQPFILPIANQVELFLFILFVTDPSLKVYNAAKSKKTIAEAKAYCEHYLSFWDMKLFFLEKKYLELANARTEEEIINRLDENNSTPKL